jgi:hypothetical protein
MSATCRLGLALMASFTSQVGDYLTGSAEVVFGLPGDLNYSKNGMIYGARLYDATRSLRISDPEFAANLDEHFRQCVFYDVLLGRYSMKAARREQRHLGDDRARQPGAGPALPDPRHRDRSGDARISSPAAKPMMR